MSVFTIHERERKGAYSVINEYGENIFYLFEEEDDDVRYSMMLEESEFPEIHIIEVEDELMLEICNVNDYKYTIIISNDIVIPPKY
jgi:hypothetical protein